MQLACSMHPKLAKLYLVDKVFEMLLKQRVYYLKIIKAVQNMKFEAL